MSRRVSHVPESFACPGEFRMLGWVRAWEIQGIRCPNRKSFEAG
jgi:hypothetical protein